MSIFNIPVQNNEYNFRISTTLSGNLYILDFRYNDRQETYTLDIRTDQDELLASGLPCVVGVQLNRKFLHRLSGSLFFYTSNPKIEIPNLRELGVEVDLLYWDGFNNA